VPVDPSSPTERVGGVRTTRRRGRTSAAKEAALRDLAPRWGLPRTGPWTAAALATATGHPGPVALDVGVGDGAATLAWATARPDLLIVALELHRPGLAKLLAALDARASSGEPANVRVVEADAVAVLAACEPGMLAAVRVLFPDPWPKRRHVARRLVDRAFVVAAAEALAVGGELHVATDWDDYADHARSMIATEARFELVEPPEPIARPTTVYERKGLEAGRAISELVARRR
jgi:tRNA (guanine-N7-)-methyltransferase